MRQVLAHRIAVKGGLPRHAFRTACGALGIRQKFTRAYRPQTNGKTRQFIQSALREWAYGHAYANSDQRRARLAALESLLQPASAPPRHRPPGDGNKVLTLHSWLPTMQNENEPTRNRYRSILA